MDDLWADVQPDAARRLLRGAVDLFHSRGYGGTSTRDIAISAGMSPAAVYVHFASKSELLFQIVRTVHESAERVTTAALLDGARPAERVRALVFALAGWHARHQRAARVTQNELGALDVDQGRRIQAMRDRTDALFLAEVTRGAEQGDFDVADLPGTTRAVVSLCVDVARWYREDGARTPEEVGALYAHLALRMLAVP